MKKCTVGKKLSGEQQNVKFSYSIEHRWGLQEVRKERQMRTQRTMNAKDVSFHVLGNQKLFRVSEPWGDIMKPMLREYYFQQQCGKGTGKKTDLNYTLIKNCVLKLHIDLMAFIRSNKQPYRLSKITRGHKAGEKTTRPPSLFAI